MAPVAMLANLRAEEMLRRSASSEEEYSTQRGVLHLGAEPRRGKMMSVPFAAGFLLRILCIRLLAFGFFVCFFTARALERCRAAGVALPAPAYTYVTHTHDIH